MHLLRSQKNNKEVENQERKEKLLSIVQYSILKNPYWWPLMTSKEYKKTSISPGYDCVSVSFDPCNADEAGIKFLPDAVYDRKLL